jgi:hypothetical protein
MFSGILSKLISKLYRSQWQIGLCRADIKSIIDNKTFNAEISWIPLNSMAYFHGDPFLFRTKEEGLNIIFENYRFNDYYGKISLMLVDENLNPVSQKILLDTKSHLSYPFVFREGDKIYLFPEAAHSGKLSCYEYDPAEKTANFLQVIIDLPLLDSTIIKHESRYWLFGTMVGKDMNSKLYIFYSDNLLGPYSFHPCNPVKNSLNGSRPAGSFIRIGEEIYRPSQNCENYYGESISINKVKILNEFNYVEEPHMTIRIDRNNQSFDNIVAVHTINVCGDIITVDGLRQTYSPVYQFINFLGNRIDAVRLKKMERKTDKYLNNLGSLIEFWLLLKAALPSLFDMV